MDAIEALVRDFETGACPKEAFHHAQHLAVALLYLTELGFDEASQRFRSNLKRFIDHHGVDTTKYNETMTMFWMHTVDEFLRGRTQDTAREKLLDDLLAAHGDASIVFRHYSRELINSPEARASEVEPDLLAVPWLRPDRAV